MNKAVIFTPLMAAVFMLGSNAPASAAQVSFDFNSLGSGASQSAITTYINGVLTGTGVTLSSIGGGVTSDKGYNGDGHVVGPGAGPTIESRTLGTSEGTAAALAGATCTGANPCVDTASLLDTPLDTFLKNTGSADGSYWSFVFAGNALSITSVAFDYEIFPDGTCATISCGANLPDFKFTAGVTDIFQIYGTTPAGSTHSPVSGTGTELTPQAIGVTAGLTGSQGNTVIGGKTFLVTPGGTNTLTFTDWPATIGIDNLTINYTTNSPVPEPGSMLLLGTGLAGLYARRRKMLAA